MYGTGRYSVRVPTCRVDRFVVLTLHCDRPSVEYSRNIAEPSPGSGRACEECRRASERSLPSRIYRLQKCVICQRTMLFGVTCNCTLPSNKLILRLDRDVLEPSSFLFAGPSLRILGPFLRLYGAAMTPLLRMDGC